MLTATGEVRPLDDMENEIIRFEISHYRGQMSEVARRLKIAASTLTANSMRLPPTTGRRRRELSGRRPGD